MHIPTCPHTVQSQNDIVRLNYKMWHHKAKAILLKEIIEPIKADPSWDETFDQFHKSHPNCVQPFAMQIQCTMRRSGYKFQIIISWATAWKSVKLYKRNATWHISAHQLMDLRHHEFFSEPKFISNTEIQRVFKLLKGQCSHNLESRTR